MKQSVSPAERAWIKAEDHEARIEKLIAFWLLNHSCVSPGFMASCSNVDFLSQLLRQFGDLYIPKRNLGFAVAVNLERDQSVVRFNRRVFFRVSECLLAVK